MSIELMFNGINIALVAFSRYVVPKAIALDPVAAETEIAQALADQTPLAETV
ncbi:uncharacterized protein METZ01_LOCUS492185, partial [marine metagenome]